jgi:hypothetical protein
MDVLRDQVQQTITVQTDRMSSLKKETEEIEKNLQLVSDADTSAGLDFRNQLTTTKLLLGIESGDAAYRMDRLQEFVRKNF